MKCEARFLNLAVLCLALFSDRAAQCGALSVAPIRLELSASALTASLTVTNTGTESSVVQLEVTAWSQQRGQDVYTPTRELLATPPIFTLPPGGSQIVRVGLRRAPDTRSERAYRLFLQEIPPPPEIGSTELRVALRIGVPIFVPTSPAGPKLQIHARRGSHDEWLFSFDNVGNTHVRLSEMALSTVGEKNPLISQRMGAYLLPGSQRTWSIKLPIPLSLGTPLEMFIQSDRGELREKVVLEH